MQGRGKQVWTRPFSRADLAGICVKFSERKVTNKLRINELSALVRGMTGHPRIIFDRLFDVWQGAGELILPEGIKDWVRERFGSSVGVEKQSIVKIVNRVTLEGALFNNLRSRRPLACGEERRLEDIIAEHREGCAFCQADDSTPLDVFGRLSIPGAVTAANVAKYDRWHSLIIPDEHNPLCFDDERVANNFALAGVWFNRVLEQAGQARDKESLYPFLMWNCLWPAGSSVVHGHLQVTVTGGMHYPQVERLRRAALGYRKRYGANYFDNLCAAHRSVGLAVESGRARVLISLTPIKEKETWIVMPEEDEGHLESLPRLGRLVGRVLACLRQTGTTSFNAAVYLPPPVPTSEDWSGFPLLARVVDRGDALGRTADFGGMELFAASVVAADPFSLLPDMHDQLCVSHL